MKRQYFFKLLLLCAVTILNSCTEKPKVILINPKLVNSIYIQNKTHNLDKGLNPKSKNILDKKVIEEIANAFKESKRIESYIPMNVNHGFFEIDFNENEINHYFTINYIDDYGIVLCNNNNGKLYRNGKLEKIVYSLFLNKKASYNSCFSQLRILL